MVWSFTGPALAGETAPPPAPAAEPAALETLAREVRELPLPERIAAVSHALLGAPYLTDPIGEGVAPDLDPPVRYDAFDCLTFVEEVLALTLPADPADAVIVRNALRYGGREVAYANRRHFMELQWIPEAVRGGWLIETTASYGATQHLEQTVTASTWEAWPDRVRFAMADHELPVGPMQLEVLPLDAAIRAAQRIKPGSLIMTVRSPRAGVPIWISHVGFVLAGPRAVFRHASRMGNPRRVRDHDLAWYLEHQRESASWPVLGVAIFEPQDTPHSAPGETGP